METSRLGPEKEELVFEWTKAGKFPAAEIITHKEVMKSEPAMPSRIFAIQYALDHKADLHLWIEDDAIVYADGTRWEEEMQDSEVGVFKDKEYINTAYFVSTPILDRKLRPGFSDASLWDLNASMYHTTPDGRQLNLNSPRVEPYMSRIAKRPWARLTAEAERINFRKTESIRHLRALLARICPEKSDLLEIDYPGIGQVGSA